MRKGVGSISLQEAIEPTTIENIEKRLDGTMTLQDLESDIRERRSTVDRLRQDAKTYQRLRDLNWD